MYLDEENAYFLLNYNFSNEYTCGIEKPKCGELEQSASFSLCLSLPTKLNVHTESVVLWVHDQCSMH